ncbi:MAG: lamin tail domain-containing protein [Phycisphaerales bacterium]|nr:MAG: lamin tail domain-containing protein [Phycisphaerales bacterium]
MNVKHATIIFGLMSLSLFVPAENAAGGDSAALRIDFTQTGDPVEAGYEGYFADHEQAATFTSQSYSAFGTRITLTPSWAAGATPQCMQMIDRSSSGRNGYTGAHADLLNDWIGTDNRQPGDPMTLTIQGLPAGTFNWISYHHDTDDQTGSFNATVHDALGSTKIRGIDISHSEQGAVGRVDGFENVTKLATTIASNGTSDITVVFDLTSGTNPVSVALFVMNGLVLAVNDPCYNSPPAVQGPDTLSVFIGEPTVIDVTVVDDGLPYLEGCDPDQPETGTSYELQYQWSQQSGPAPVGIDPVSADVEDPTVTFTQAGTYELLLQVSDGPVGLGAEDGKIGEFLVTAEVIKPFYGDIDRNEIVDLRDLRILADQWLDSPVCLDGPHCADLDYSGSVTGDDFALLSWNWLVTTTRVVINEFVASNVKSLTDGDGNTSDWIELYNPDAKPVSLNGWHLTDDAGNLRKWTFPATAVVPAEGYLVVFASGQAADDYVDSRGYLHTNFALDRQGEYLALVNPGGAAVHQFAPSFPPQETDISCGMWHTVFRYFAVPTPGQANKQAFLGYTAKTSHSHSRGFYDEPFLLRISCDTPGAFIRYTLDGSEPTEQYGTMYDPDTPIPITTTTHVRSVAIKPGYRLGDVTTHTYIFVDDVAKQPANPPGWPSDWGYSSDAGAVVPADYEMDPRVVNSTLPGYSIRDALLDIPTVSISMLPDDFISDATGIYSNSQSRWERKCSVEYILPDGTEGFQHDCEIEVHGNASRRPYRMQKHSLRLTFSSLYGTPKLRYPLFPESDVEEFNQLVLRASFTDSWGLVSWGESRYRPNDSQYIRDVWMKESLGDMGQPSNHGNFVHLYVNGLYFGIHNLTERFREELLADRLGGEPEDWEINEDLSSPGGRWNAMMSINPATSGGYAQMKDYLDVENFADYMLLHFYADAEDWPHHNGYAAANAVSGDGRFRFFVWDQEIVLDYHGRAASRIGSSGGAGSVFQKMRTSEEFRLLFTDRVYKHCYNDGALSSNASQGRYLKIANWIDKAIVAESARWGDTQMSTPYGNTIRQPSPLDDINHNLYPPAPHGPDYYFTREDSWVIERDNVINNYIPAIHDLANSYALINVLRATNLYPDFDPPALHINGAYQHGGHVSPGDVLTMTSPSGKIYYAIDGNDVRMPAVVDFTGTTLVSEHTRKCALVPSGDIGTGWRTDLDFDESGWTCASGAPGGVGYETGSGYQSLISIDVRAEMYLGNASCYIRIPFTVDAGKLATFNSMVLKVRYDDGFIAYLNGGKIEEANPPTSTPQWNSIAAGSHGDPANLDSFNVTDDLGLLQPGDNLLAIHGLNTSQRSSDFLISAELVAGQSTATSELISDSAIEYSAPVQLYESTHIKARVLRGTEWSALNETIYAVGPVAESLRITEIMYHPPDTGDPDDPNEEFIELKNIGTELIDLNLVRFTNGVDFTFPRWELGEGEYVLVVQDQAAFEAQYPGLSGITAGQYTGSLQNNGERIKLADAAGTVIHNFRYEDGCYDLTDGLGFSLTIKDPAATDPNSWDNKAGWRPSGNIGGSPGWDDSGDVPALGSVKINELLAHSHAQASDWIELHNTTGSPIHIGGWFLSDDNVDFMKYEIADGTWIDPCDYVVFYENLHFGNIADPGCHVPFALSENGETLYLHSGRDGVLTGYSEEETFGASATGIAFGRYKKSGGTYNFVAMSANTPGFTNAYPKVGPIVITEIMYNSESGDQDEEYIEMLNISGSSVVLYDYVTAQPWKFTDGIELTFPTNPVVTVPAGGYVLAVKDLAAFTLRYGSTPSGVQVFEYDDGRLDNGGEKLEIGMPGDIDTAGVRQYIRIDRVNYSDGSHPIGTDPWPSAADGGGQSLNRKVPSDYGNDVANWQAGIPSPGQ